MYIALEIILFYLIFNYTFLNVKQRQQRKPGSQVIDDDQLDNEFMR